MQPLRTFAPYAFHCLKVWVGLVFAVHHKLFKWNSTHMIDIQYLNYLPFCQVRGTPNRSTAEARSAAARLVDDPADLTALGERLRAGTLAPGVECLLWYYAHGKPREQVQVQQIVTLEELVAGSWQRQQADDDGS